MQIFSKYSFLKGIRLHSRVDSGLISWLNAPNLNEVNPSNNNNNNNNKDGGGVGGVGGGGGVMAVIKKQQEETSSASGWLENYS